MNFMKKLISALLCVAMMISCTAFSISSLAAEGNTYYVDSIGGSDANSGKSPSQAWCSLAKASSQTYEQGDRLLFKAGGVYGGSFTAKGSGTGENPITVSSYGDINTEGKPLIYNRGSGSIAFYIHNVDGWSVENLEIVSPDGAGLYIAADNNYGAMRDFSVKNCTFHNISNQEGVHNSAIRVYCSGEHTRVENVYISDLNIFDCGYGLEIAGNPRDWGRQTFFSVEESYNRNVVIENVSIYNIVYDGMIIGSLNGGVVRDCAVINTTNSTDHYTAPLWLHHLDRVTVENCEVAGSKNYKDGMTVDFDGWSTNSTYQYIYSHDNIRFVNNCVYEDTTKNANCTVRYCLSVNDNKGENTMATRLHHQNYDYTIENDEPKYMDNFKFYNNTIINGSSFDMYNLRNSYVANNIFYGDDLEQVFKTMRVSIDDETGKKILREFTGEFTNNCFYGCAIPTAATNSVNVDPQFIGTDIEDKNSFILSTNSKLIGAGVQVEDDMGEHDFYGNPLTEKHNIGCYEGEGEQSENKIGFFAHIKHFFQKIIGYIVHIFSDLKRSF